MESKENTSKGINPKVLPIFLVFMVMGFGDVAGPLAGIVKEDLQISNFLSQLIPFSGYILFGLLSIPLGLMQDRKGKKYILVLGLSVAFLGLMLPTFGVYPVDIESIAGGNVYQFFILILISILFLGLANTTLQVAGNPIVRDVSKPGMYSRNLSIGQFIKAIGTLSASVIPLVAVRYFNADWKLLFPIYSVVVLLTLIWVAPMKIKEQTDEKEFRASFRSSLNLLKNPYVLLMVLGIFVYVGSEIAMRSNLPIYLKDQFGINIKKEGLAGVLFFDLALLAGRFLGGIILNWLKPKTFFRISVFVAILGILGLFIGSSTIGIGASQLGFISAILIGLGFANIFPLIFSITIDSMPERSNELSGLMVTAIVGGAFIPPLMGLIADQWSILAGFIVPVVCILYITSLSLFNTK
jgi:fucose permease